LGASRAQFDGEVTPLISTTLLPTWAQFDNEMGASRAQVAKKNENECGVSTLFLVERYIQKSMLAMT
jgi:hypothetical protein